MNMVAEQSCKPILSSEDKNPACAFQVNLNEYSFLLSNLEISEQTISHSSDCYKQESLKHCNSR